MHSILKPGIVLLIITAIAAGLLGVVNNITAEPIAKQKEKTAQESMQKVLPEAKEFKKLENLPDGTNENIKECNEGYDDSNNLVGYAVSIGSKGYGGEISIMVGISSDGVIQGVNINSHSETPGLGANSTNPSFIDQYKNKSGELTVTKNAPSENEIQAITSATITSKAVTKAVNEVTEFFNSNLGGAN